MCRTDPDDVARMESNTWLCTRHKHTSVPRARAGIVAECGQWMSEEQLALAISERFPGCMSGRIMYVIPFSMGPLDAPLAKYAVQLTDLTCVVYSMHIMTRVSADVFNRIRTRGGDFVRCVHSVGLPRYQCTVRIP